MSRSALLLDELHDPIEVCPRCDTDLAVEHVESDHISPALLMLLPHPRLKLGPIVDGQLDVVQALALADGRALRHATMHLTIS